jgi:hypothetical protein
MRKKFRAGRQSAEGGPAEHDHVPAPEAGLDAMAEPAPDIAAASEAAIDELRRALREAAEQVEALRRQLAERDAQFNALLSGDQPVRGAARELQQLRRQVAAQGEALQRREWRRQFNDAQLREREVAVEQRDAEIAVLRTGLQELDQHAVSGVPLQPARAVQPEPSQTELAEARIAAIAGELAALHARTAVTAPPAVEAAGLEAAGLDQGLQAELDELRHANERLRAQLAERDLQRDSAPASRDTGTFATTGDFGTPPGSGTYALADGELRMLVRTEGDAGIVHVLGRRTTVGRTPDNDLCIDFESVSRHHAVALQTPGGTVIEDLNSTNGVYVNGHRISRRLLTAGDLVTIGTASFRFLVKPADEAANS